MNRSEEEKAQLSAIGYEMDGTDMKMDADGLFCIEWYHSQNQSHDSDSKGGKEAVSREE